MAEVGVSVVTKLAEYLVDPTLRQLQYLFCVGKIIRNVEIRKEELILKQGRVQERIQEAINRTERIDDAVNKWKSDVKSLIAELENLEEELKANNGCLQGWRPTWRRYLLCKKLAKKTKRMIDLNTKSDCFNPFSHPVIIPDIEYHASQNFKLFNSTQMAFDQLWEALKDDCSFMIGLWGMGGLGKTTLVTEVGKKAKESQLFDRVVRTTISQSPDIRKIQDEIADTLGIKLEEQSEIGRAKRIALRLENKEKILIILDDAWAKLDLEHIGVPLGGNHQRSCKVVLTTRRLDVCTLMECQKMIQLDLLKEDEAWTLFQTHANVGDVAKEEVARAIAMECKGLPIAIVAVGISLKGKGIDEMNDMLCRLRNAEPIDVDKGVMNAFTCLELSYDYLAAPKAKKLLLMCAVFPEDHNIDVEDLFRYGMGLGLYRGVESFETARSKVRAAVNHLIASSLLMRSPEFNEGMKEYVRMHDVVRDFALWKASKEDRTIMVDCTEELDKLVAAETVNDCYAFSSWYNNNRLLQFLSQFCAPKLEFLLLCFSELLDISHATFEGTKGLKALIIMHTYQWNKIELQPQSIQHLSNLQTLRLKNWNLHDISFVVSLTRLEILDLQGSEFARVPNGIEKLGKLRLLDLSECRIDECCYKVIGRFSQLEELYVSIQCSHLKNENCYEYLVGLTALIKLRRYKLEIGEHRKGLFFRNEGTRYLCLSQLSTSMLGAIIKDLAQRAIVIRFHEFKGGSNSFMANIVQAIGSMNELTKLYLQNCSEIECITDETTLHEDAIVPRLDELVLEYMDNLKQLHRGPSSFSLFQKLERLSIFNCPQLLNMFPTNCNLGNLKFLSIFNCPILTSLFPVSATSTLLSLEELEIKHCNELKHVLDGEAGCDTWENLRLPNLKILFVFDCCKLESICTTFLSLRFVQLQHLSIIDAPQMKFVFAGEQLMHDQDETQIVLPLLEYLHLEDLPSLVRICSERDCMCYPSIKTIIWRDCPNMELQKLNVHQLRNEEYKPLAAIERINKLHNCGVESIFYYRTGFEEQVPTFLFLKELTLEKCARLKFVFSAHIYQFLPELTFVTISYCEELEAIFLGNEEAQKNLPIVESFLLKLKKLQISNCNKLKFVLSFMISAATSMLPQLSTLYISDCSKMEEVFKCSHVEHHDIDSDREITLPNMKSIRLINLPRFVSLCQGLKFHIGEFDEVRIYDCPKLMPVKTATIDWTKEGLVREYELKDNQLNDNEALNLPLSVLIAGELDIQSPKVEHNWRIIGDNDQEETNNSGIFRSEQQMLGGLVPTQVMSFQYLHSLEVTDSKKLKFLFTKSTIVHNGFPKLKSLTLSNCEELEEIIAENEDHQVTSNVQVGFPKLRWLTVWRCNKLKRLFSAFAATILSQLRYLSIACSDHLEVIFGHSSKDDAKYSETIVLSNLRKIELRHLPNFMSVYQGLQIQVELRDIMICNCPKFVDSSLGSALQQLGSISRHVREYELKYSQLNNRDALGLPLSVLNGGELDIQSLRVEHHNWRIIGDDGQEETDNSEILRSEQQMLGGLVPTKVLSFQYLHSLEVTGCKKLKFLFSVSTIVQNSLPKLTSLTLYDCEELEVIFGHSGEDDANYDDTIVLSSLRKIELLILPNFKSVCQVGLQSQVELRDISICNCPKFVDSCLGSILQQLGTLSVSIEDSNVETSLNVNEEKGMVLISRVEHLRLKDSMNLTSIWEGPTFIKFQNLVMLIVMKCKRLRCIFPCLVMRSLPCLVDLRIEECEELEEIMASGEEEHNHFPHESSNNSFCFPQLKFLAVHRCKTLKWLFPSLPSTLLLPHLNTLWIEECSELKGLFNSEVEIHEEGFYNNSLPKLTSLKVTDCPFFSKSTLASLQKNSKFSVVSICADI